MNKLLFSFLLSFSITAFAAFEQYDVAARLTAGTGAESISVTDLAEETAPAAGDYVFGWESGGALRKFDLGDLDGIYLTAVPDGAGGTNLTCSGGTCSVDDAFILNSGDTATGSYDFSAAVFEIPNAAAPTTDADGEIAFDNNAWAASHGALQFFDGTATVYVCGTDATDTPTDGQVVTWNTGGTCTWEDGGGGGSGEDLTKTYTQASHTFATGDAVYWDGDSWELAQADSENTIQEGIVSGVSGDDFDLTISGYISGLTGLTSGEWYYLDQSTAGDLTSTQPTTGISASAYKAISTTEAIVYPPIAFSVEASEAAVSVKKTFTQVSHGYSVGDPLYWDGDSWELAQADDAATLHDGIVSSTTTDTIELMMSGYVTGLPTLTADTWYYLDQGTAGDLTATAPTTGISAPVLRTIGTTTGIVVQYQPGQIDLSTDVTGTLPAGNGGTGTSTTFTQGSIPFAGAGGVYTQDNASLFWDDVNNRLGIGTASPVAALHVASPNVGAGASAGVSMGFSSDYASIELKGDSSSTGGGFIDFGYSSNDFAGRIIYNNVSDSMIFSTNTAERLWITSSGTVGIGTSDPDRKLDILDVSGPQLRLTQADGSVYADFQMNSSGDLVTNVDGRTNQFVLDNGGNVGIGTSTPSFLLDVSGIAQATGGFRTNSETVTDWSGTGITVTGGALTATLGTSVDLASEVTGTLPAGNGGTGVTALTSLNLNALGSGAATNTQVATANGAGGIAWVTPFKATDLASGTITARADDLNFSGGSDGDVWTVQADGSVAMETPAGDGGTAPIIWRVTNAFSPITSGMTSLGCWRVMDALTLTGIQASLVTGGGTSGTLTVDVQEAGTSIMTTDKLDIQYNATVDDGTATLTDTSIAAGSLLCASTTAISTAGTEVGLTIQLDL